MPPAVLLSGLSAVVVVLPMATMKLPVVMVLVIAVVLLAVPLLRPAFFPKSLDSHSMGLWLELAIQPRLVQVE